MRSQFETGLASQSEQAWLLSFERSGDELAATGLMRWPEISHIDTPPCHSLSTRADQGFDNDADGAGPAANATLLHKDCHV